MSELCEDCAIEAGDSGHFVEGEFNREWVLDCEQCSVSNERVGM